MRFGSAAALCIAALLLGFGVASVMNRESLNQRIFEEMTGLSYEVRPPERAGMLMPCILPASMPKPIQAQILQSMESATRGFGLALLRTEISRYTRRMSAIGRVQVRISGLPAPAKNEILQSVEHWSDKEGVTRLKMSIAACEGIR